MIKYIQDFLIALLDNISDLNQVFHFPIELLSVNQKVIFNYQLEVLSDSLVLRLFVNTIEGLSHDGHEHIQKNYGGEHWGYDEQDPQKDIVLRTIESFKIKIT